MKKVLLLVAVLLLAAPFALYSRLSTQDLILQVTTPGFNPVVKKLTWAYIRMVGGLHRASNGDLRPLHFALSGCYERLPDDRDCAELVEALLKAGYPINEPSNDKLALTPMHGAALACAPRAIEFLVAHGGDVNAPAGNGKYPGMTPLRFIRELKTPCAGISIVTDALKKYGAHE